MADRRVPDLSYGHLGDASYDIDEGQWKFSIDKTHNQIFEQIAPFKENLPPSIQTIAKTTKPPPKGAQSQMKWAIKTLPETFPANVIASALTKSSTAQTYYPPSYGQLVAVGGTVDSDHQIEHRRRPIIATPCGEAGHVLRLTRPQAEHRGWRKQSSVKLPLLDAASGDIAYWIGTGGTIRQIAFSSDGRGSGNWLAVRQDSMITIFRPTYHKQPVHAAIPSGYDKQYPPSRLSANPAAVLKSEICGLGRHADMSFNPFYTRQFGVVDDSGHWSIWDIEGRMSKNSALELVSGKSGGIYDDFAPNTREKGTDTMDGWHRILWVANVSTIVVCNRVHIAAFDVKSAPSRLPGLGPLSTRANDWILDIKRSPMDSSQMFILTTSRVFWVEVIAAGGKKDGHEAGIRVMLSYRHFRDVSDETLSLTVLLEDDVSVLLSSAKTLLVNFFTFSEQAGTPTSFQGSFSLSTNVNSQGPSQEQLQATCFVPAPTTLSPSGMPGPELQLTERNVKFYQVWALSPTFALKWTLCAMYIIPARNGPPNIHITAPTIRLSLRRRLPESGEAVVDSFVVADDLASEDEIDYVSASLSETYRQHQDFEKAQNHLQPWIDWRNIFQRICFDTDSVDVNVVKSFESMSEVVDAVSHRIGQSMEADTLPMTSLLELSQFTDFSGDLQESAPILSNFLGTLQANQNTHESVDLILSNLNSCPGIGLTINEGSRFSDLLGVYDQVGEHWMASLPLQVSNLARLSKFKVARKVAVELYLSLISVSIRNRSSQAGEAPSIGGGVDLPPYSEGAHDSDLLTSSQIDMSPPPDAGFSLPTPSRTPSEYSHMSNDTSELAEDPSISRLRQYAVSIKSRLDLGEPALLSQWPSTPGVDPAQYSWRSMAEEAEDEFDSRRRRDEARRRRRTEKFLNRERPKESQASSQPTALHSGSQPELGQPAASSQSVGDVPMTQPDRGVFGARSSKPGKKKQGKRRAAGF